jgi:hypothetical protein
MNNADPTFADAVRQFVNAPAPGFDAGSSLLVRTQTTVLVAEFLRVNPAEVVRIAEPLFRDVVFRFFRSNTATAFRHAFPQPERLFADASYDVATDLLEQFPELREPAPPESLAHWIANAGLELTSRGGKRFQFQPDDMNKTTLQLALLGIGIAAGFVVLWDWFRTSPEFTRVSERFGRKRWARKLLRRGPLLAARSQWSLAAAWTDAERDGALDDGEVHGAIRALSAEPEGQGLSPAAGSTFDTRTMDAATCDARFVVALLAEGLEWNGRTLLKARVDAGTADYVAIRRLADGARKHQLIAALGCELEPGVILRKAAIDDVLDASSPEEADAWLKEFCDGWPPSTVELIEPKKDEPLDERTMRSTKVLRAPQHARVEAVRHRGLRRAGGEVLVRARVETSTEARPLI